MEGLVWRLYRAVNVPLCHFPQLVLVRFNICLAKEVVLGTLPLGGSLNESEGHQVRESFSAE